jgi:hypothetical protein
MSRLVASERNTTNRPSPESLGPCVLVSVPDRLSPSSPLSLRLTVIGASPVRDCTMMSLVPSNGMSLRPKLAWTIQLPSAEIWG